MSARTNPTTPRASLLGLPWELREQIYQDYFKIDGGYVYDGDSEKLIEASGQPVDISIRYACRLIANETRHFPFSLNAITFSTVYRQDWRKQAGLLGSILQQHTMLTDDLLIRLRRLVTPEMYTRLALEFPQHLPNIKQTIHERLATDELPGSKPTEFYLTSNHRRSLHLEPLTTVCGTGSDDTVSCRAACAHIIRSIAEKHPAEFLEAIDEILPEWSGSHAIHEFFDLTFDPWAIPSLSEIMAVAEGLQIPQAWYELADWYQRDERDPAYQGPTYRYRRRYRFSATAIAIRFLNRVPQDQRLYLRKLVLDEDRIGASYPECHAVGLIPFCKENPKLHIEQRFNLWRHLVVSAGTFSPDGVAYEIERGEPYQDYELRPHQLCRSSMTEHFTSLVMSVLEVLKVGMPPESYTCVIDGEPDLNLSTNLFNTILKRDIAWLTLHTECVARGLFTDRSHPEYPFMTRSSAETIEPLKKRTSILQCNFTLDQPWNYEEIAEEGGPYFNDPSLHLWWLMVPLEPSSFDVLTSTVDMMKLKLEMVDQEKASDGID